MRLTTSMRDSFIRAAMADVPRVDYDAEISKVACADAAKQLPPKIRAIYNDKTTRHFIRTDRVYIGGKYVSVPTVGDYRPSDAASNEVSQLSAKQQAQADRHSELRQKLRSCAYACATRKALLEMLPEFEKYLPADAAAACRTLPVVANVVTEFVKAGWPVGKAKGKVAAHV